jgi:hypothetical protein
MLENSLKIRQRFINKLTSKINELNADFALLNKVDRKISRSNRLQRGGADEIVELKELQETALIKRLQIEEQNAALKNAIAQATELTGKISEINAAVRQIEADIKGISIDAVDLTGIKVPNLSTHLAKMLEFIGKFDLSTILKDQADGSVQLVQAGGGETYDVVYYTKLMAKILSEVYNLTVTSDDVNQLRANLKIGNAWDKIVNVTNGSEVVANDGKKLGITQRLYEKLQLANPVSNFGVVSASSGSAPAAREASPVALSGTPPASAAVPAAVPAADAAAADAAAAPAAGSSRKYFW